MKFISSVFLCFIILDANGFEVAIKHFNITYINPKYGSCQFRIERYSRRSDYFVNANITSLTTTANNVSIHLIFFEYLNNQYKRSFVEMHFRFCDMINEDPYFGGSIKKALLGGGYVGCPLPPGLYRINNMSMPIDKFGYVWPFSKARMDVTVIATDYNETIAAGYGFFEFINKLRRRKN